MSVVSHQARTHFLAIFKDKHAPRIPRLFGLRRLMVFESHAIDIVTFFRKQA